MSVMVPGAERRRAPRYPIRLAVTVVAVDGDRRSVHGHSVDLCLNGMRIVTEADLCHGHDQTVVVDVPGDQITAAAEIVWTTRRGEQWVHGLLLRELEPEDGLRLARLCTGRS